MSKIKPSVYDQDKDLSRSARVKNYTKEIFKHGSRPRRQALGTLAVLSVVAGLGLVEGALEGGPTTPSVKAVEAAGLEVQLPEKEEDPYMGGPMEVQQGDTFESMANRALGIGSEDELQAFTEEDRQDLINRRQAIVDNLLAQNNGEDAIFPGQVFEPLPPVDPYAQTPPLQHGTDGIAD